MSPELRISCPGSDLPLRRRRGQVGALVPRPGGRTSPEPGR